MPPEFSSIVDRLLGPQGMVVLIILILYGVVKETPWWVPGHIYRKKEKELETVHELVMTSTTLMKRSVDTEPRVEKGA